MTTNSVRREAAAGVLVAGILFVGSVPAFAQEELVGQWTLIPERSDDPFPTVLNPLGLGGTVAVENDRLLTSGTPTREAWPANRAFPLDDAETSYVVPGSNDNPPSTYTSRSRFVGTALVVTTTASREGTNSWTSMFTMSLDGSDELEVVVTTPNLGPARTSSVLRYRYSRDAPRQVRAQP